MQLSSRAKNEIIGFLSKNKSKIPSVVWACNEGYSDPVEDGYLQFGFYDLERIKQNEIEYNLIDIEGIKFVIVVPESLKFQLYEVLLDYLDSQFIILRTKNDC